MKRYITPLLMLLAVFLGSCGNFDELNTDPARSSETQPEFLLANAQKRAADLMYDSYFNGRIGMELAQYWMGTDKTSDGRFLFTNDGLWTGLYTGPLMDLKEIDNYYTRHPAEKNANQLAVAEIMKAWIFHVLTDVYVDIPYSQTLQGDVIPQPMYDKGKDVYAALLTSLKTQIDVLSNTTTGAAIRGDVIANSSAAKWIRIANALRMRMAMRMADVMPSEAKAIIEEATKNTLTGVADDVFFPYNTATTTNRFPYNDVDRPLVEFAVSATLVDYLKSVSDPRLPIYARPDETNGQYIGKVYGTEANSPTMIGLSKPGVAAYSGSAKGYLITYAEIAFIRAEAAARGMSVGGSAESLYNTAVAASMNQWGITDAKAIDAYVKGVPYSAANWKDVIGTQKWLALYMQGIQAWLERLRLDPKQPNGKTLFIAPASGSLDPDVKLVPTRLKYPSASRASNAVNSEAAAKSIGGDTQATKNWWDTM